MMSLNGYLLFDDTVADKNYSREIDVVRRQYSDNAESVIRCIGIVTCIYANPETAQPAESRPDLSRCGQGMLTPTPRRREGGYD
jgi:polyferredoxin